MKTVELKLKRVLTLALATMLMAGPAFAEKPEWKAGGKAENKVERKAGKAENKAERKADKAEFKAEQKADKDERRDHSVAFEGRREYFEPRHQTIVQNYYGQHYYGEQYRGRACPPGLAKKNNGCMPPGLAKNWNFGQPLARNVTYYQVPQPLLVQIGQPPAGYRYVRVGNDILLLSPVTGLVVDALQNLRW